jgi:hypothetical protein
MIAQVVMAACRFKTAQVLVSSWVMLVKEKTAGTPQIALRGLSVLAQVSLATVITSVTPIIQIAHLKARHARLCRAPVTGFVSHLVARAAKRAAAAKPAAETAVKQVAARGAQEDPVVQAPAQVVLLAVHATPRTLVTLREKAAPFAHVMSSVTHACVIKRMHAILTARVMWSALLNPATVTSVFATQLSLAMTIVFVTRNVEPRVVVPVVLTPTAEWDYFSYC